MAEVHLEADGWSCAIAPDLGGAVLSLAYRGEDVLRSTTRGATHPFQLASFVMAPYANRIANGSFVWDDAVVSVPPNIEGEKHPLHGVGFSAPWRVIEHGAASVTMELLNLASDAWPWRHELRQRVELGAAGFAHTVEVLNTDNRDMPAGLGFHPYFAPAEGALLSAAVDGVWTANAKQLPVRLVQRVGMWRQTPVRGDFVMDNCFIGWASTARVDWQNGRRSLKLDASGNLNHLHVYAPPDASFFCLEPVSHRPNAINGEPNEGGAMRRLLPGEDLRAWMRISWVEEDRV